MKVRLLRIGLGSLICLALLATFSASGAQAPTSPAPPEHSLSAITEPPPPELHTTPQWAGGQDEPRHSTGYVPPPMDLSHLTGQRPPLGGARIQALPAEFDWRNTGKVTPVKNQSTCGCCYAFASIGNFESKLLIDGAGEFDLSENHAKECNWYEIYDVTGGTSCSGGDYFHMANLFSKKGTVLETDDPFVPSDGACTSGTGPYQHTLLDWRIISGNNVPSTDVLKQYIYNHGPVYTTVYVDENQGFDGSYDGSYTFNYTTPVVSNTNHAVLIVGWSDNLPSVSGGMGVASTQAADGWIVKNSWGTDWGDGGYFYITYGSANIGMSSSFMYDWQDYDPDGDVWYYDEGGWSGSWGTGTTDWGMAVFTPTLDTNVTRVEFWTTDRTTDVDVYIYDDFALNNELGRVLDSSFNEAGYHSVPLPEPIPVSAGDDVVAVVQFTNESYPTPVPIDNVNTSTSGNTYTSPDGSSWSKSPFDVAIRLRTSAAPTPNVGIAKRVIGSDFEPGDPVTFTLTIANSGSDVAAHVVVTDDVPSQVLTPTYASTLALTQTGVFSYVWNVEPLGIGEKGVITIYGWIDPDLDRVSAFTNTATISDPGDNTPSNNTSEVTVGERKVYLPLLLRNYPPPPTSGFWRSTTGGAAEFYVTTGGNYVDDFAVYINVPACGLDNYKVTHTSPEPITNYQFSFEGSFHASGTFSSETTASGTAGFDHYFIGGCGYISSESGAWSATWQDDSQPASTPAEIVGSVTPISKFYTVTPIK
jgi:uncharacterized repeat protein (TIGR01451 family)